MKVNILEHSSVAETKMPYAGYYGWMPEKPKPNSLFLFTDRYYTLEESLRFIQRIDICSKNKVNAASSFITFHNQSYPAIRVRNFPDYEHLKNLQECFQELGVTMLKKSISENEALITVNKCFLLEQKDDDIYLDLNEKNEGYIVSPDYISQSNFESLINEVRNNSGCDFFDAARGGLIMESRVVDMIRIYSEHLNCELLKCLRQEIKKQLSV